MSKYEIGGSAGMKMREGSNSDKKGCLSTRAKFMLLGLLIITLISVIVVLAILIAYKDKVGTRNLDTHVIINYSVSHLIQTPGDHGNLFLLKGVSN